MADEMRHFNRLLTIYLNGWKQWALALSCCSLIWDVLLRLLPSICPFGNSISLHWLFHIVEAFHNKWLPSNLTEWNRASKLSSVDDQTVRSFISLDEVCLRVIFSRRIHASPPVTNLFKSRWQISHMKSFLRMSSNRLRFVPQADVAFENALQVRTIVLGQ